MSKTYNGGISVKINNTLIDTNNGYSPSWTDEKAEDFENHDFTTVTAYKGVRFSASFKIAKLSEEDKTALLALIAPRTVTLECPDFTGTVNISGVSANLDHANHLRTCYTVSFTAVAAALTPLGGGL